MRGASPAGAPDLAESRLRLLLLVAALSTGCGLCENTVVSESPRPAGPHRAVVFVRSCGAMTSDSTHIALLGKEKLTNRNRGNVFVAAGGTWDVTGVAVRWLSRDHLEVRYAPQLHVVRKTSPVRGVEVSFVRAASDSELNRPGR